MDSIQIKNLRSLQDTKYIDINKINILVGQNSSGKSTYLRFFPLLKQSIETDSIGSILWYGNLVDFGSFKEALSRYSDTEQISFGFRLNIDVQNLHRLNPYYRRMDLQKYILNNSMPTETQITIKKTTNQEHSQLQEIKLVVFDSKIQIHFDSKLRLTQFSVNSTNLTHLIKDYRFTEPRGGLLPTVSSKVNLAKNDSFINPTVFEQLSKEIKTLTRSKTPKTIEKIIKRLQLGNREQIFQLIQEMESPTTSWTKNVSSWHHESPKFNSVVDLIFAGYFEIIYDLIDLKLRDVIRNIYYIAPLRASAERYYRMQGLAVREVDAQGRNLPMFIRNLSNDKKDRLNAWLKVNFNFELRAAAEGGHLSLKIKLADTEDFENITDMGFGYSQMIPILIQLWIISTNRTMRTRYSPIIFVIEQPELHLHPKLQAKLADVFIAVIQTAKKIKLDIRLIIETHSETMINRFGNKIATEDLEHGDIDVLIFEKDNNSKASSILRSR